jgi:uncharacterized protein YjiK
VTGGLLIHVIRTSRQRSSLLLGVGAALMAACADAQTQTLADRYDLERPQSRFHMPGRLDEISGLALTPDGRLFTHNDEEAVIYQVDLSSGSVTDGFRLGETAVKGDFEGIAVVGERFFLVSSIGILFEFREAGPGGSVPYRETDTGLGEVCEVEGLAHDAVESALLLACKQNPDESHVVIHRLPLDPSRGELPPLRIPQDRIRDAGGSREFNPSAIAVDPGSGHLVLLSARQEQILEITASGEVVSLYRLDKSRHPRPEGLEFGPGGSLLISDEKDKDSAAVTVYTPRQASRG